jgi:hypothetical protein
MTLLNLFLIVLAVSLIPVVFVAVRAYSRAKGARIVTCPETKQPVAVRLDPGHVAATTMAGEPELRLESCTRWPERQHCGQECLSQIEASPEGCLVRNILAHWYEGASCALCGNPIKVHWGDNKPALMTPDHKTLEWDEIRPEALPQILATHQRVCWSCHVANTFHDQFPDLVTERKPSSERHAS